MPTFAYSGRTRAGQTVSGERGADSMEAAVAALRREQVLVTRIAPAKAGAAGREEGRQDREEGQREEPGRIHAPVLGDDRRRPAAGAVPRDSWRPGGRRELRGGDHDDAVGRRIGRHPRRRDAETPEDVRSAVHQHDCGRRSRRHPRHDSQASRHLHREGREARRPGEVGDDLSDRRDRHRGRRGRRHPVEGDPDLRRAVLRPGRPTAAADAHRHRPEQQPGALFSVPGRGTGGRGLWLSAVLRDRAAGGASWTARCCGCRCSA